MLHKDPVVLRKLTQFLEMYPCARKASCEIAHTPEGLVEYLRVLILAHWRAYSQASLGSTESFFVRVWDVNVWTRQIVAVMHTHFRIGSIQRIQFPDLAKELLLIVANYYTAPRDRS